MRISVNWVKQFTDIDVPVGKLVEKIGAQLGEVEEVVHLGKRYQDVVIAKVEEVKPHPSADRLTVCKISDSKKIKGVKRDKDGLIQVVCGAPNVREDMMVAWLPPGATVPRTFDKDPFVLEARDIRGQTSNGMLASAHELDIGDDHSGIMEIGLAAKPGDSFSRLFGLDDYVIDIENKMFTHRPDCFGLLGIAREIAGINRKPFTSPDWYLSEPVFSKSSELPLQIKNEVPKLASRFMAVAVENVNVGPSKFHNQSFLSRVGIKPVNNIVDLTNFMMYLTGQPMHAYDYDKVKAKSAEVPTLVVRHPKQGEKLKVLGGKVITPKPEDIMIATDKELIGFGGVIGGEGTEVDENTTRVIFECANFDLYSVRKTSMAHGLFTDAVTRFSKGQSPLQTDRVLAKALELTLADSDAEQASDVLDDKHLQGTGKHTTVEVSAQFINARLGLKLSEKEIRQLLGSVELKSRMSGKKIRLSVPFWRTDIEIPEDVVEEVGRLYGYNRLPLELPTRRMSPSAIDDELRVKSAVRGKLSALGASEVLSYSFVHGSLLEKTGQDSKLAYQVKNALSPDLQYYRLSLTPSLLQEVHPNRKAGFLKFALFEIGKVHSKQEKDEDNLPKELGRIGFVISGDKKTKIKPDYFLAKHYLEQLYPKDSDITYQKPGNTVLDNHKTASQMLAPFEPKRSAVVFANGKPSGVVGEYRSSITQALKLPINTAGFEVFLSSVPADSGAGYKPISKYPYTEQDISLRTSSNLTYAELEMALNEALDKYSPQDVDTQVRCIDIFQKEDTHKQTAFRIKASSHERTLTAKVVSLMLDKVAEELKKAVKAERI